MRYRSCILHVYIGLALSTHSCSLSLGKLYRIYEMVYGQQRTPAQWDKLSLDRLGMQRQFPTWSWLLEINLL